MIYKEMKSGVITGFIMSNVRPESEVYTYAESSESDMAAWIEGLPSTAEASTEKTLEQRIVDLEAEIKALKGET